MQRSHKSFIFEDLATGIVRITPGVTPLLFRLRKLIVCVDVSDVASEKENDLAYVDVNQLLQVDVKCFSTNPTATWTICCNRYSICIANA